MLFFLRFLGLSRQSISLVNYPLLSPLSGSLGLRTLGIHFILQYPLTLFLGLGLVNLNNVVSVCWERRGNVVVMFGTYMLDQRPLVLKGVTLAQLVQFMIEVLVNLASCTVLDQKSSQNS